jgi:ATP-dependent phosphofructokinase / diphosphate-dependent phosphofructokinase
MVRKNAFYAQSGGVTAVINASACGVLETARQHSDRIANVYAGRNGIIGALTEDLIDTSVESEAAIAALKHTPGAAFGSCRHKLGSIHEHHAEYERLIEVFRAHDIGFFFYNGGGDSQDTAHKVSQISAELGEPIVCAGIPKTVDNDLAITDCSPGFGSAAKYLATSLREAAFDLAAMSRTSTQVFVLEVMGRHAGWTTAACALAAEQEGDAPHVLLMPEVAFNEDRFLAKVTDAFKRYGHCVIAVSEGVKTPDGQFLSAGSEDAFGHAQLGGVAPLITSLISAKLGFKCHWAVPDYLQRSARHIASKTDVEQAYAVGRAAVEFVLAGRSAVMPAIRRISDAPYRWDIMEAQLSEVANQEKLLPPDFISPDGFGITEAAHRYLAPLIIGENYPPFKEGLPNYVKLQNVVVPKKLASTFTVPASTTAGS